MRVTFLVLYILGCAPYLCHKKKNIMAKSRLTPDYIEWVMSLNVNQALREIRKVNEQTKDFEKANSKLAGVLGSTKAGIAGLTDEARRLGATTAYTASEVTGLQVELAKLGFGEGQIKSMEEAILKFALAVDTDLGSAASVAGGALRAFGLEAEDAESAMATLAIGTTTSALSFNDYATMLSTTAPVAKAFGFTLEDTVARIVIAWHNGAFFVKFGRCFSKMHYICVFNT